MKWIFLIALPLYTLDQWSKNWILAHVATEGPKVIIPGWFDLVYVTNNGAAFGSFQNNNIFFIILSCVALVAVLTQLVRRNRRPDAWRDVSLALLLAGVLGNLTDRFLHGHVIDFLLFDLHLWPAHPWPAFNVADSCICVAVICFVIYSIRIKPKAADQAIDHEPDPPPSRVGLN